MTTKRIARVVIPDAFRKDCVRVLSDDHIETLKFKLAANPALGDMIPQTGGCRKIWQFGIRGQSRVIYYHHAGTDSVYLLACYPKNQQKDLSETQKRELKGIASLIKDQEKSGGTND